MELRKLLTKPVYFISGIDTDAGKTIATGWLSHQLLHEGVQVITQKLIQTGNEGMSEDIERHRQLEGRPLQAVDLDHTTHPLLFKKPCSPHMAAELEHATIDLSLADHSTQLLLQQYELILLEGAGGLMVPLHRDLLTIDFVAQHKYPVILVSTAKLGSINHTLLSLEALKSRHIEISAVIYNEGIATDSEITLDTRGYLQDYLRKYYPTTPLITLPHLEVEDWRPFARDK